MMVEVPAAAIAIDLFDADFFSIGSNDLTQYVTAAGRDIASVAALADPAHPAVLRLIETVVASRRERAAARSRLCGDAGGDPALLPLLLRRGLRAVSVAPALVGRDQGGDRGRRPAGARAMTRARCRTSATKTDAVGAYKRILPTCSTAARPARASASPRRSARTAASSSQITNPAYPVPIPAQHLAIDLRDLPLLAGRAAGLPGRLSRRASAPPRSRSRTGRRRGASRSTCPTSATPKRNRALDDLIEEIARRLAQIVRGIVDGETT